MVQRNIHRLVHPGPGSFRKDRKKTEDRGRMVVFHEFYVNTASRIGGKLFIKTKRLVSFTTKAHEGLNLVINYFVRLREYPL